MKTILSILMMMFIVNVSFAQINYFTILTKDSVTYQNDDNYSPHIKKWGVRVYATKLPKFLDIAKYEPIGWDKISSISYHGKNIYIINRIDGFAPAHVIKDISYVTTKPQVPLINNSYSLQKQIELIQKNRKNGKIVLGVGLGLTALGGIILATTDADNETAQQNVKLFIIGGSITSLVGLFIK